MIELTDMRTAYSQTLIEIGEVKSLFLFQIPEIHYAPSVS